MRYRVWWIPQIGASETPFYIPVESPQEGKKVMDILAAYDCFQYNHNIKPDYSNTGGLEMYDEESKEWTDWYYEDDDSFYDDVDQYIAERSPDAEVMESFSNALFSQVEFNY